MAQRITRVGEEDPEMHHTATFGTHPPPQAAGVQNYFLDGGEWLAAVGSWPDWLAAVSGPQEVDQRRTVAQTEVAVPSVPILDVPVPLMVCGEVGSAAAPSSCSSTLSSRASRGPPPRPCSDGTGQASHSHGSYAMVHGPREARCSHAGRDSLHGLAHA